MTPSPCESYHLWCRFCAQQKYKFFVVAYTNPRMRFFLINSEPAPFQRNNPVQMAHQVLLKAADHNFLTYDSYLDCSQLLGGFTSQELEEQHALNPAILLGQIAPSARLAVKAVVTNSTLLTQRDQREFLACW